MSKLYHTTVGPDKVIIGEFRADIEADQRAEKKLAEVFLGINVFTTIDGKKMVPIQELLKIEEQVIKEKAEVEEQGYDRGYKEGLTKGYAEAKKVIDNFTRLIQDAVSEREVLYNEARRKILELVLQIARKVTFDAARIDADVTASIISGVIDRLVERSKIKVKVHPDHLPLIEQQIDRFRGDSNVVKEISIEPDTRVRFGGCFIETPTGDIDARVDTQMDVIAEAIQAYED
nr:hypothetical protein [candidate division Zixibacteria bacterium]